MQICSYPNVPNSLCSQVFGDLFVHSGTATSLPIYYDPNELLSEPTVDPMIPM